MLRFFRGSVCQVVAWSLTIGYAGTGTFTRTSPNIYSKRIFGFQRIAPYWLLHRYLVLLHAEEEAETGCSSKLRGVTKDRILQTGPTSADRS